jgi:hypothetical protein
MKIDELSPAEVKDALMRTQLGIVFANFPDQSYPLLQAAHGNTESFIILRHSDQQGWDGWRLSGAPKEARREKYHAMLRDWKAEGIGQTTMPDGRDVENTQAEAR